MIHESVDVFVHRPVEEVFDYVVDVECLPEWDRSVRSARLTGDPPVRAGTTYSVTTDAPFGFPRRVAGEVREFVRPRRVVFGTRSPLPTRTVLEFKRMGEATRVVETLEVDAGRLAGFVVRPLVGRSLRDRSERLRALKRRLESNEETDEEARTRNRSRSDVRII